MALQTLFLLAPRGSGLRVVYDLCGNAFGTYVVISFNVFPVRVHIDSSMMIKRDTRKVLLRSEPNKSRHWRLIFHASVSPGIAIVNGTYSRPT